MKIEREDFSENFVNLAKKYLQRTLQNIEQLLFLKKRAVVRRYSIKQVPLNISQNSQKNTRAGVKSCRPSPGLLS